MTDRENAEIRAAFDLLCKKTYALAKAKGWHEQERNFGELIALCHSELSEALESWRETGNPADFLIGPKGRETGVPSELADVIIRVAAMCGYYDIDLGRAVVDKHEYNTTRSHRHGGKHA